MDISAVLTFSDAQLLIKASLSVRDGAWRLLATPALLASAASTLSTISPGWRSKPACKSDSEFLQSYMSARSAKYGGVPALLPIKQHFWDRPSALDNFETGLNSTRHRISFLAAASQYSGDWLFALRCPCVMRTEAG